MFYTKKDMPKKTIALISGLVIITVILFFIAINSSSTPPPDKPSDTAMKEDSMNDTVSPPEASPTTPQNSILSINPNPLSVKPGETGTAVVSLNNMGNEVTAIQLEVAYDPNYITNVKVSPGELFSTPVVLINKNNQQEGRYTYAYGIMPNHDPITQSGQVAIITFTAGNKPVDASQLALLPTTLVTARGISNSVLKSATGTLVQISGASAMQENSISETSNIAPTTSTPTQ